MKHLKLYTIPLLIGFLFFSCTPETYEPVGEPYDKIEGVKGTWKLASLVQFDEIAIAKELSLTKMDITNFFNFENFKITFNVDENDVPTTFEVENPDNAPHFFTDTGLWCFDNADYPSQIHLIRLNAEMQPIDTVRMELEAAPLNHLPLRYKFGRKSGGEKIVSYSYLFQRVTQ